jgi:hypothetical protein
MSDELDLDAFAAAEAEAAGEGFRFTFGGDKFVFPKVLPMEFLIVAATGDYRAALLIVLDADDAKKFWSHKPGRKVIEALDEGIAKHYGFGKWGNSSASAEPSLNGTGRSRPTSAASTA